MCLPEGIEQKILLVDLSRIMIIVAKVIRCRYLLCNYAMKRRKGKISCKYAYNELFDACQRIFIVTGVLMSFEIGGQRMV